MVKSQIPSIITNGERETIRLGEKIGEMLQVGDIVALFGGLGTGKTVLVKGIAKGLEVNNTDLVVSPTFIFVNTYQGRCLIYHFDLYRLENIYQVYQIGWYDFLEAKAVIIIEWADKIRSILPKQYLYIKLEIVSETERKFELISYGKKYKDLIKHLTPNT